MEFEKIDLLNEQGDHIRDIMSRKPVWMVRWGTTLIFIFIAFMILLSWIIKYPDVIPARIVITTPVPPARILARAEGPISQLLIEDQQPVYQDQILAMIGNPADLKDVNKLEHYLGLSFRLPGDIFQLYRRFPEALVLGTLQTSYGELKESIEGLHLFIRMQPTGQQLAVIDEQLQAYQDLFSELNTEDSILKEELLLAQSEYRRFSDLLESGSISEQQWEEVKRSFIRTQERHQRILTQKAENHIRMVELQRDATRLKMMDHERMQSLMIQVESNWESLSSELSLWKENYLIQAPIDGIVSLHSFWSQDQAISRGEEFCTVIPSTPQLRIGKMIIPVENAGKAQVGQKVLVQLESYPSNEYGMLRGEVKAISLVPRDRQYTVEVVFPEGMQTTYQYKIPLRQEMTGRAEIITQDIRLIQRILFRLKGLTQRYPI